ncbi:uncharacterized protein CIMG_11132 [Coccidioides immitis RS]|uniref:Uncharacterized protein n=1 Tax=Coccidioides immitis (strain RS) TaxID=246410 RepID=A0A0D8JX41_COCIM|nr:uncharacterized protein CIMG_11132 [Coccidioides immitis RS]KJF61506.1 hypothetical protein CIMG_11132 [Coccidioides immitis RS]
MVFYHDGKFRPPGREIKLRHQCGTILCAAKARILQAPDLGRRANKMECKAFVRSGSIRLACWLSDWLNKMPASTQ